MSRDFKMNKDDLLLVFSSHITKYIATVYQKN